MPDKFNQQGSTTSDNSGFKADDFDKEKDAANKGSDQKCVNPDSKQPPDKDES